MSKRGNQEGSIHKRADGRWVGVLHVGYANGKRQRKYFYADIQREARAQLDDARRRHEQGTLALGPKQTVKQFLTNWLEDTARHRLRPSTFRRYEELTRLHAIPTLGKLTLTKLTPQHLSHLYGENLAKGLSPRTVEFLHRTLHVALKQAVLWGLIPRNPADAVKAPKPKRPEIHPLTSEQAKTLLDAAQDDPLEALYVLALTTGMRQGELLGLQWDDIDWTGRRLAVRHTLQWGKGGQWGLDEPKTGHSRRTIKLPPSAVQAFKAHKARQAEQHLAIGPAWQDHGLIFTNAVGRPIDPCALQHRGSPRLLDRAGLPKIRFHDLRHTYATLALRDGKPVKVVSEALGHASIALTLSTYSHVLPDMQDDLAATMEGLLGRSTGT